MSTPQPDVEEFREGFHEYGEVRCEGCNDQPVDLSDAGDIHEALDIWNDHVEEEHRNASSTGGDR